jgi:hypothetical protein
MAKLQDKKTGVWPNDLCPVVVFVGLEIDLDTKLIGL